MVEEFVVDEGEGMVGDILLLLLLLFMLLLFFLFLLSV